jgi:hypothetical protein
MVGCWETSDNTFPESGLGKAGELGGWIVGRGSPSFGNMCL